MNELVYCNLTQGTAKISKSGAAYTFRPAVAGEVRRFSLRFCEDVEGITVETDPDILSLQLCVGQIDARPLGGKLAYQFGSGTSMADNTTAELPYNHNAAALKAALPAAVVAAYGSPVAEDVPGGVTLTFAGEVVISPRLNSLWPLSFLRSNAWEIPAGGWVHDLRLVQAPLVQTTSYVGDLPPAPFVTTLRDGGSDASNTYMWSEIQELTVPVAFRGTYHLRNPATLARSAVLSTSDTLQTITDAVKAIYPSGTVNVTNPTDLVARIEFLGDYLGVDMGTTEVFVDDAPPEDPTLTLDFRLASVYAALRDTASCSAFIEARALIARDGVPEGEPRVLFRQPISVLRDQNWDGMSDQVSPLWQRPANPVDYVPYSDSQVIVGSHHYSATIGGSSEIVLDVGFDIEEIASLIVRENSVPGNVVSGYTAAITGAQSVTLTFAEAPAANSLVATLTGLGPVSAFQAHEHPQEQITGLVPAIEDVFSRIARLESLIGRNDVAVVTVSGNKKAEYSLPSVGEVLPDIINEDSVATVSSQISVPAGGGGGTAIGGTELEAAKAKSKQEYDDWMVEVKAQQAAWSAEVKRKAEEDATALAASAKIKTTSTISRMTFPEMAATQWPALRTGGKLPYLLPAINDAAATSTAVLPASPVAGSLYTATAAFTLPGGSGRKSQNVLSGNAFGYDGRCFYRVVQNGDSWSALEMERELLRTIIRPEQFPAGSDLALSWNLTASLVCDQLDAAARDIARTVAGAQYLLVAEAVPIADATSPGTPGLNLGSEGTAVTLCSQRISLSPAVEEHTFALALKRDAAGAGTGTLTRYGTGSAVPNLPSGPFVLRLRLAVFDVDDTSSDARGQVKMVMPATTLTVTLTK